MRKSLIVVVLSGLMVAACSGGPEGDGPFERGPGADTAESAVEDLIGFLSEGDFGSAASLAVPDQAALASLAEGATVGEIAEAVSQGDALIASNFWSGFAQSVEPWLGEELEVVGSEAVEAQGMDFSIVEVKTAGGVERSLTTRDLDGYRIDIFATFGPSLAGRLYPQIERLLTSPDDEAGRVLKGMRDQVPSLHLAAETPGLAPNVIQDILQLIELITRVN